MLKNAVIFCLNGAVDSEQLAQNLERARFTPLQGGEAESMGFYPINESDELVQESTGNIIGRIRVDKKVVPASALREAVAERAAQIEQQQGYKPGRKQLKEIKEAVLDVLRARALASTAYVNFYFLADKWFVVDTSSHGSSDKVLGLLAKVMSPFPLAPWNTARSPMQMMTARLVAEEESETGTFTCDDMAQMKAQDDSRSTVTWQRNAPSTDSAQEHFKHNRQVVKMAMTYSDRVSFVLTEKGIVSKIKFLDVIDMQSTAEAEDEYARLQAGLALFGGEMVKLIEDLTQDLGGLQQAE